MNDNEELTEIGYVNPEGRIEVNLSSIYTRLIQEAGRWCESYASDLLVDIDVIKEHLNTAKWQNSRHRVYEKGAEMTLLFVFGFRRCGVDHKEYVDATMKEPSRRYHYYRAIWNLTMEKDERKRVVFRLKKRELLG